MNPRIRPIMLLTFVNAIGSTLLIPVLPFVVRDLGYSDIWYTVLIAAYPAAQFFAAPILGGYADYRGRRPVLIISQAGTLLSWVLFASAYFIGSAGLALAVLALSRLVDGLTGGNQSVAAAYLADVVDEEQRTKVFSTQGAISGVALLIGPTFGAYSGATSIGFLGTAIAAIAISLFTLLSMRSLVESLPVGDRTATFDSNPLHQLNLIGKARTLTNRGPLIRLFSMQGIFNLTLSTYSTIAVLWYVDGLGVDETDTGLMLLLVGVFLIFNELVSLPLFQRFAGDTTTLVVGLCILPIALALTAIPTSVPPFLLAAFLLNLGLALVIPTIQSIMTRSADPREEGTAQGINTSVTALASAIAPITAGIVYGGFGGPTTFLVAAGVALVAALVALVSVTSIREAIDERPRTDGETHRRFGPIAALAHFFSMGRGGLGLRLHGDSFDHHNIRSRETS